MIRIDKFLWAVRLFKTRSLASEACQKGRVLMGSQTVKPSRTVNSGDIIAIKEPPAVREYKVLDVSEKRMGAKLVADFLIEVTPSENLEMIELAKLANKLNRQHGLGRPTKKERRELDNFMNGEVDEFLKA
ncbi:MAG: RNA-binding S4 domain-containing protein [Cytophagaceae bacterium]|jgi:ribosome-associated heat shock protein Hsp15|nr:RNA-binding S4 domain-containing protein [Cytophagaceae bacterium]